jgi:hypothetical protein
MKAEGRRMNQVIANLPTLRRTLYLLLILHPSAFILSCASVPELPWAPVAKDASAGFYNTARLEYRLDAGKLGQPLDVLRVDGRRIDFEQIASSPLPDRSVGTLMVQKPHPAGREGFARVTFSIDSAESAGEPSRWNPLQRTSAADTIGHHEEVHETWAMDIPAVEADHCFQAISAQNFYTAPEPDAGPAQLSVTLDGKLVQKNWPALPELNALAQRVRSEGRLVAYLRPEALSGETSTAIVSVRAYRELLAKTGQTAASASPAAQGVLAPEPNVANKPLPSSVR